MVRSLLEAMSICQEKWWESVQHMRSTLGSRWEKKTQISSVKNKSWSFIFLLLKFISFYGRAGNLTFFFVCLLLVQQIVTEHLLGTQHWREFSKCTYVQ